MSTQIIKNRLYSQQTISRIENNVLAEYMSIDKRRIEESYDLQAETYQESRQVIKLLLRDIQIPLNPSGLDIGCSPGGTTFELYDQCRRQGKIIGVDIPQKMVEKASQRGRNSGYDDVRFMKMDAESLEFKDDMFDVVTCIFTFQFFPDKMKALREIYKVLRPGGYMGLFFSADKMFMYESFEIFRKIAERHRELSQFSHVLDEYMGIHITQEEFQDMLYSVGFTGIDFFGKHRVYYVNSSDYLSKHPYSLDLFSVIQVEDRGLIINEAYDEMVRLSDTRGFRLTRYFIQGLAQKPGEA